MECKQGDVETVMSKIMTSSTADKLGEALNTAVDLLEEVQKVVVGGRPKAVRIRLGDKTIAELPLAVTAAAVLTAGLAAVLLTKLAVDIVNEEE